MMLSRYGDKCKEIEDCLRDREHDNNELRKQNRSLKDMLDQERQKQVQREQNDIQLEEERFKRKTAERELENLRQELLNSRGDNAAEVERLKRAIDDLKYQNEEQLRLMNAKDEEVRFLHKDLQAWKEVCDKSADETSELKAIIADIEDKNRRLSEKLNEVIYNKASAYKAKTL